VTHAHAPHEHAGKPARGHPVHVHTAEACPSETFPVAVPGRALPAPGSPVIRRKKADAEKYAKTNKIDIVVSKKTVEEYVNDTDNDDDLRRGLLDAWNLDASSQWIIDTPADLAQDNPFHHSNFQEYQDFTKTSRDVSIDAFGGSVSAFYNRGAPKIGSSAMDWNGAKVGDSYKSYVTGLRSGGETDADIATALLEQDDSALLTDMERRAAAMMTVTVYLAEEWRKQGAAKIYRAYLRLIADGERTFDDFLKNFKFIISADAGRKQVGTHYDVHNGDLSESDMDTEDQAIHEAMSDIEDEDFSSDDEMRTDDKKNLKKNRFYAEKHKS
jgi:hypothetical protein